MAYIFGCVVGPETYVHQCVYDSFEDCPAVVVGITFSSSCEPYLYLDDGGWPVTGVAGNNVGIARSVDPSFAVSVFLMPRNCRPRRCCIVLPCFDQLGALIGIQVTILVGGPGGFGWVDCEFQHDVGVQTISNRLEVSSFLCPNSEWVTSILCGEGTGK